MIFHSDRSRQSSNAWSLDTIRVDAPFAGDVLGVKIPDSVDQVTSKLGKPISKVTVPLFVKTQTFQYPIDDSAYARPIATGDGVQTIFIVR
ncbi:hypothetical protein J8I87_01280 [Paraburkholderia sp. LEh10]|uniref:hypothetical protein n=1 Tax=Paraburkholderia sp. LEh10 TaxID=2821353 RepID=UPI001AEADEC2|nr:hypothetical protein [Paraburkholderia sp. LEh10]MBP0588367.1 hypothetical protein [Paraburkholderia sp. LEh10]